MEAIKHTYELDVWELVEDNEINLDMYANPLWYNFVWDSDGILRDVHFAISFLKIVSKNDVIGYA